MLSQSGSPRVVASPTVNLGSLISVTSPPSASANRSGGGRQPAGRSRQAAEVAQRRRTRHEYADCQIPPGRAEQRRPKPEVFERQSGEQHPERAGREHCGGHHAGDPTAERRRHPLGVAPMRRLSRYLAALARLLDGSAR